MTLEWDEELPGSRKLARFDYETGWSDAMADCSLQFDALVAVSLLSLAILAVIFAIYLLSLRRSKNSCYTRLHFARLGARLSP
jgi:hypothetical protein